MKPKYRMAWGGFAVALLTQCPAATGAPPESAAATGYPSRPIRLLVGLPVGGTVDLMARITAAPLSESLGRQIVVDNRLGASGRIAAEMAANAPADGYTLLFGAVSYMAIFASLYPNLPYDPVRHFAPLSLVAKVPNVLVVNPATPVRTVKELVELARSRPGALNFGSAGQGSSPHLAMELLQKQAGIRLVHVPYKGGPQATADLLAGQIQVMFTNLPEQVPLVTSGKTRALAVTSATRNRQLPDVPTMIEAGMPGFEVTSWSGMFAPARVPEPILTKLGAELQKALGTPTTRERMAVHGAEPAPMTRKEFASFQHAEVARWAKVVKDSGVKAE